MISIKGVIKHMISQEKLKILEVWSKRMFDELSIAEVMKLSKKKTKPWVFITLKLFVKYNLLISKRKGNTDIYSLNLHNPLVFQLLHYLEVQGLLNFSQLTLIKDIISTTPLKNYCLLVFGSFAEGKQRETSDIDVCFLINSADEEKIIKPYVSEIKLIYSLEVDDHYILFEDFIKMLLRKEENLAKQIFKKNKIFFNPDIYYQLILEAYKNGFRQ